MEVAPVHSREFLAAAVRQRRELELDDELVDVPARVAPGKQSSEQRAEQPAGSTVPGKLSRWDAGRVELAPAAAIDHAAFLLDRARRTAQIDRRAERDGEVDDGALAAAFTFIDESRGGRPLPDELRKRLEAELGVDLGAVRLHTDDRAAAAAAALGARAFTIGDDVYFAAGAFAPDTDDGVELIAHEIGHVAQQRSGGRAPRISRPGDPHERDADAFATRFRARERAAPDASDPASLVEHVRRHARRIEIPHLAEIEAELGTSLGAVEAFTGDAAALACRLMSAAAFAVRNVVAFADPSPRREQLLHELTHVVQMGHRQAPGHFGFGSLKVSDRHDPAEVEARAGGAPTVSADPDTVHRDDGTPRLSPRERWDEFARVYLTGSNVVTLTEAQKDGARFGCEASTENGDTYEHRYLHSSAEPFTYQTYAGTAARWSRGADDIQTYDLTYLFNSSDASSIGLAKVGEHGQRWAWLGPGEPYPSDGIVIDLQEAGRSNPEPWRQWRTYSEWAVALAGKIGAMTLPAALAVNASPTGPRAYTRTEATEFRRELYRVIAEAFAMKDGQWKDFYDTIVVGDPFSRNPAMVGNAFEEVVALTLASGKAEYNGLRPHFDFTDDTGRDYLRVGDGEVLRFEARNLIVECKAYQVELDGNDRPVRNRTLDARLRSQAEDYAKVVGVFGPKIPGYDDKDGVVTRRTFDRVMYVFATAEVAGQWRRDLTAIFQGSDALVIVPPIDGTPFDVSVNPTFTLYLDADQTNHHLANPPVFHPGVTIPEVDINLSAPGGDLVSGSIAFQPSLGTAMTADAPDVKPLTATATGGRAENGFSGVEAPTLRRYLPDRFTIDARLTDDGVEATVGITAGPSGIPGFDIEASTLTARYGDGGLTITGDLGLAHTSGKLTAHVAVGWDGTDWTFDGSATVAAGIIEGLGEFTAQVRYDNGQWAIGCESVTYERAIGAVTLTGTVAGLWYDVDAATFSGLVDVEADLGMFGTASARAEIVDNALASASLSYDSPDFTYPAGSENPSLRGALGGTLTYENGQFSGAIRGTANLDIPALQAVAGEAGVGLAVDAQINPDGTYGGTVSTTTPIRLGSHLEVPSVSLTIGADGAMSGAFSVRVVDVRYLDNASLDCTVDATGVHIADASVTVAFGEQGQGQFWGSLTAGYSEAAGLSIGGAVSYQIKEGMIATGTLAYAAADESVSLTMTVSEITLLDSTMSRTLFSATKQIPVFNVWGIGIYLDLGFDLGFDYGFDLRVQPAVSFEGLQLDTFAFTRISASLQLLGDIYARLTGTPRLGLGIFALDPRLLRGGGGVRIPIVGEARIAPTGALSVEYTPDGGITGDASVSMAMTFGINGSVTPYAELSVLDGMWSTSWQGDALGAFEILPPREIFNFTVDLAGNMTTQTPTLPETNAAAAPAASTAGHVLPETHGSETEYAGPAADATTTGSAAPVEAGDEGPFSLAALAPLLEALPGAATIKGVLDKAGEVWGQISGFFDSIIGAFSSFFAGLADRIVEILDGFAQQGLGYVPALIHMIVGDDVFSIIEPLVTYMAQQGNALLDLFRDNPPPTDAGQLIPWVWTVISGLFNLASGSLIDFVNAIRTMMSNLLELVRRLINQAVDDGWIGVKRHFYYIPIVNINFLAAAEFKVNIPNIVTMSGTPPGFLLEPSGAVALCLYELLEELAVPVTFTGISPEVGEPYNDRWRGEGARG